MHMNGVSFFDGKGALRSPIVLKENELNKLLQENSMSLYLRKKGWVSHSYGSIWEDDGRLNIRLGSGGY